ncbi:hypothetical protein ONZ45_g5783 [Pleurotus djamor]|nr:hypothetical protein ONZ45_g5783 [Pleurotus djamor]
MRGSIDIFFPPEILRLFVTALGSNERDLLIPLIFVSRQLNELTLPILYESITIVSEPRSTIYGENETQPTPLLVPAISIHSSRIPLLHATLSSRNGTKLSACIKTLIMHPDLWRERGERAKQTMEGIGLLPPGLFNLQRLSFNHIHPDTRLDKVIPKTLVLTHFGITSQAVDEVLQLLKCQPSLRVLAVKFLSADSADEPPVKCTLNLPRLHTYIGSYDLWKGIYESSPPIQSLSCRSFGEQVPLVYPSYSKIKHLDFGYLNVEKYYLIFPTLKCVEHLRIALVDLTDRPDELIRHLRQIPSRAFKYLAIHALQGRDYTSYQPILAAVFEGILSLLIVDFTSPQRTFYVPAYESARYTRTSLRLPGLLSRPTWLVFGWWWHRLEDDLEAEGKKVMGQLGQS